MSRLTRALYLLSLALIPWQWIPPFPWLHEHAQWSDVVFLVAVLAWLVERTRAPLWPSPRPVHLAMALYLGWAIASHLAHAAEPRSGSLKLLGMAELALLALMTAEVASTSRGLALIARTLALTSLLTALAALAGVVAFALARDSGFLTDLGDLEPGAYARARAGFHLPNLLASFTIVAASTISHRDAVVPRWLKRLALAALAVAASLSMSRGLLGLVLTAFFWNGDTLARRRAAGAWAVVSTILIVSLTYWNVALDPLSPWSAHLRPQASSRWAAVTSSAATLAREPLFGVGPGNLPGSRFGQECDAHLTLLNIASTLGLPAAIAFAAIPILLWRSRERPTDISIWIALVALGIDALGQDVEDFRHVWLAFGLALRSKHLE